MKKIFTLLLIPLLAVAGAGVNAQCTNNSIRPDDGFTLQGWNPTCNGGTDGYINISGITSSSSTSPDANRSYSARILTGIGGGIDPNYPIPYPIPLGSTFQIPNLPAGTYVVDIIDQCGGNSADKTVTISQPANPEFSLSGSSVINRVTRNGICGDTYVIDVSFARNETGQLLNFYFTNNLGATYVPVNNILTTVRTYNSSYYAENRLFEVPFSFFNGGPITVHLTSNLCNRAEATRVIALPPTTLEIGGAGGANYTVQSTVNPCVIGYGILRTLMYGTAGYTGNIVETANPTATALDINGNPFVFTFPPTQAWPYNNYVYTGLKYGVAYTITYTDACGKQVVENLNVAAPVNAVAYQGVCPGVANYSPFIDDAGIIDIALPTYDLKTFPITFKINSGPANWVSTLGETTVTVPLTYPQIYTYNQQMSGYQLGSNININSPLSDGLTERPKQFAEGIYNITYTDACGRTNTFDATVKTSCLLNSTTSTVMTGCAYTNGNVDITHTISPIDRDTRSLYRINTDGTETLVSTLTAYGSSIVKFTNVAPGTYKIRFGGVSGTTKVDYPGIGGLNGIPRIAGTNYIYEETVIVNPFEPLSFGSLAACNGAVTGTGDGGQAPYQYTLLNAAGTSTVRASQSSGTFAGLTIGTTYTMQVVDGCGRTFNQQILITDPITPTITNVVQSTCSSTDNSISFSDLPTGTWTLTDSLDGTATNGSGTTFIMTNLPVGTHSFTLSNDLGCSAPATPSVIIAAQPAALTLTVTNPAAACVGSFIDITSAAVTAGSDAGIALTYFEDASATTPLANPNALTTGGTYYIKATAGNCSDIKPVIVVFNLCYCTKDPLAGTPDGYTKVGITVQQKQSGWPENIPNGFIALESKEKGLVITRVPHVSTAPVATDSVTDPIAGMLVYDIQDKCVKLFNGTSWNCIKRSCND